MSENTKILEVKDLHVDFLSYGAENHVIRDANYYVN